MKQFVRNVHPLCWFLLIGSVGQWLWDCFAPDRQYRDSGGLALFILIFIVPHTIIYWLGFTLKMRKNLQWFLLAGQMGYILIMTRVSHDAVVTFILSLVFFIAAVEILQQFRLALLAIGGYLVLLLLYAQTLGSQSILWSALWRGDTSIIEIPILLILSSIAIYLQQRRAHERTRALLDELNTAHAQLSAYALRVEELTMVTERQRLARELHDTLTQGVAGLIMQLEAAHSYLNKGQTERGQEIVFSTMTRARTVLTETRYVLQDLRAESPRVDDLTEMVQEEIEHFSKNMGIACDSTLNNLVVATEKHSGHILRAISEVLTNVARHAQATHVWVCTEEHEGTLTIEVRDDGVGFDPLVATTRPGHYGLIGLRERVRLMGGQLAIRSAPGQGTSIQIALPLTDARRCA